MAKENYVQIIGVVESEPKYNETRGRTAYEVQTIRSGKRRDNLYVQAYGAAAMAANEFKVGDLVMATGVVAVNDVKKTEYCPSCEERIIREMNVTEVAAVSNLRLYEAGTDFNLEDFADASNVVKIMGTVLFKPNLINTGKGPLAKYIVSLNRRFIIDGQTRRQDDPYVVSYGKQAMEVNENLRTDSLVYINGAMQTRNIEIKRECPYCKCKYKVVSNIREIIPYNIEFLANCEKGVKERPRKDIGA